MKIFLSWSGSRSRSIAEALREWLPNVIQALKPWMSADDIEKGARWSTDIAAQLSEARFGIICLTAENQISEWIHFEAGALSKTIEKTYVVPYLYKLEPADIKGPLVQFQPARVNKEDTKQLILTINRALYPESLSESRVDGSFELWWPKLEEKLNSIPPSEEKQPQRTDRELLEELLELAREQARKEAQPSSRRGTARLIVRIFDGTRRFIDSGIQKAITITDGNMRRVLNQYEVKGSSLQFVVDSYDNFGDNYTVIVAAPGYKDGGRKVTVSHKEETIADVMLLPTKGTFKFPKGDWASLKQNQPELFDLLVKGAKDDQEAKARYTKLRQEHPSTLAAIMNITAAMALIELDQGTVLDYFKQLIWDDAMTQDRFYAYADIALIDQVKQAATVEEFAEENNPGNFHPGATLSFKQTQFKPANVQLTFYEKDEAPMIDGKVCVKVESDIDYPKDLIAHGLGEVLPNKVIHGLTNHEKVYMLEWIGGGAGMPKFDPPYVIA